MESSAGLGIDLDPAPPVKKATRRPLPRLPSGPLAVDRMSSPERKAAFADKSPSIIGTSQIPQAASDDDDDDDYQGQDESSYEEYSFDDTSQQHEPESPQLVQHDNSNTPAPAARPVSWNLPDRRLHVTYQEDPPARVRPRPTSMVELGHVTTQQQPEDMQQHPEMAYVHDYRRQQAAQGSHLRDPESPTSMPGSHLSADTSSSYTSAQAMAQAHLNRAKSELNMRAAAAQNSHYQHQQQQQQQSAPPAPVSRVGESSISFPSMAQNDEHDLAPPPKIGGETLLASPSVAQMDALAQAGDHNSTKHNIGTETLQRQSTLLSAGSTSPHKRQQELKRLLAPEHSQSGGPSGNALKKESAKGLKRKNSNPVTLEQAKSGRKARVELDVTLESGLAVEGGLLKGHMEVKVRPTHGPVWIGVPKARIVGFEELASGDTRHIFYHHAAAIGDMPSPFSDTQERYPLPCFLGDADDEGFRQAVGGTSSFPLALRLPTGRGAKGSFKSKAGEVRYIVIGSIKLKDADGSQRSIAHFYRHIDVFPFLDPTTILRPLPEPIKASSSKSFFFGGDGKVALTASVHRDKWIAGQKLYVNVDIRNDTNKRVKAITLSLIRTTATFRPKGSAAKASKGGNEDEAAACQTQTNKKKIAETTLEGGKKASKGDFTAKGNWLGVDKQSKAEFMHSLVVPPEALSITKGRHLEVTYAMRVTVSGGLGSDVSVELPVHILNFISLDPPPGHISTIAPDPATQAETQQQQQRRLEHRISRALSTDANSIGLSDLNALGTPSQSMQRNNSDGDHAPRLNHRMSLECINTALASSTSRRQEEAQLTHSPIEPDEVDHLEDDNPEGHESHSRQVFPSLDAPSEEEEEQEDSEDEIASVLDLERARTSASPLMPAEPIEEETHDPEPDIEEEDETASTPTPDQHVMPISAMQIRAKVSPDVRSRRLPQPPPHQQPITAKARPHLPSTPSSLTVSNLAKHSSPGKPSVMVSPPGQASPSPRRRVHSAATDARPRASHASGGPTSAHRHMLSPFNPQSPNAKPRSVSSSPDPGLSPSGGSTSPSTSAAVTPPLEQQERQRSTSFFGAEREDKGISPALPKHLVKGHAPRVASVSSGSPASSVRSKVAALESHQRTPSMPSAPSVTSKRAPSLYSVSSDAASLRRIARSQSTTSLKAPIWRNT